MSVSISSFIALDTPFRSARQAFDRRSALEGANGEPLEPPASLLEGPGLGKRRRVGRALLVVEVENVAFQGGAIGTLAPHGAHREARGDAGVETGLEGLEGGRTLDARAAGPDGDDARRGVRVELIGVLLLDVVDD